MLQAKGVNYQEFTMGSFLDVRTVVPLARCLKREKPDILQCHLVRANLYGRLAARLAGIQTVICTHHGVDDYTKGRGFTDRMLRKIERITDGLVTCHVGVSESMRRSIITNFEVAEDKVVAIQNGITINECARNSEEVIELRKKFGIPAAATVVGLVGNFTANKNFKMVPQLAKVLIARHPTIRFVIVGDGKERIEVESIVRELQLQDIVILPRFRADIAQFYSMFDIFVSTSLSEGFGLAVAEAMAAGLPCVAYDVGALGELIVDGQTGILVSVGDEDMFENSVGRLVAEPGSRSAMGMASRTRIVDYFSVKSMVRQYDMLYESVLQRSVAE